MYENIAEMETFNNFFRKSKLLVRRMSAYYNLSKDEVEQEVAIVYYENPIIEELFLAGQEVKACNLFGSQFIKSLQDFSPTGIQVKCKEDYDRVKSSMDRLEVNSTERYDQESEIMILLQIDELKKKYGEEEIEDILEYYEWGYEEFAEKRGISGAAARTMISRRIAKIRDNENKL